MKLRIKQLQLTWLSSSINIKSNYLLSNKMPIRKHRVHCTGLSVRSDHPSQLFGLRSDNLSTNVQLLKPSQSFNQKKLSVREQLKRQKKQANECQMTKSHYFDTHNLSALSYQNMNKSNLSGHRKQISTIQPSRSTIFTKVQALSVPQQKNSKLQEIIKQLRKQYQNKGNIKLITRAWGFQNKGSITNQRFKEVLGNSFKINLTSQQTQQIVQKFSSNKQRLDVLGFVNLLYDSVPFTKPHIDKIVQKSGQNGAQSLFKKIKNINETTRYLEFEDKQNVLKQNTGFSLQQSNKQYQLNKQTTNTFLFYNKPQSQLTQPSMYQSISNKSAPRLQYITRKQQSRQYVPSALLNKNQQKTRHGATPSFAIQPFQKRQTIIDQKCKVLRDLQQIQNVNKVRYQNKLQKIRVNRQREKENIAHLSNTLQLRNQVNIKKTRQENFAYQYVNFIQNQWK